MKKHPILYESTEKSFMTNGIGVLSDALQCDVTEELNGMYELFLVYPLNGALMRELRNGRIIYADASKEMGCQPFRILRVNKLLNGLVNVYAVHISYDLSGIQLPPFDTAGISDGMSKIKPLSTSANDFKFESLMIDAPDPVTFTRKTPISVRSYLMGAKNSLLQAYGGEFVFDGFQVRHAPRRGSDKGYRVRYGVNLIDLNQEESVENTYTGFYPYYKDEYMFMDLTETYDFMYPHEVDTSKLVGKIMNVGGTFGHSKIVNVDLSPMFELAPLSTDELREVAEKYKEANKIGIPTVSLDLRFESLKNLPEYSNIPTPEDVALGDTIHVDYVKIGVSATARVNSIVYDSLRHQTKRVAIGDVKNSIADSIVKSINTQKTPTISGDKLNLSGYVTFAGLGANGTTEIDGGRIKTGEIKSQNYTESYILIFDSKTEIYHIGDNATGKTFYFETRRISAALGDDFDYENIVAIGFEFKKDDFDVRKHSRYSVRYYKKSNKAELVLSNEVVETTTGIYNFFAVDSVLINAPAVVLSTAGTSIDLNNGNIVSESFSSNKQETYFRGDINSNSGRIGGFFYNIYGDLYAPNADLNTETIINSTSIINRSVLYVEGIETPNNSVGFAYGDLRVNRRDGSFYNALTGHTVYHLPIMHVQNIAESSAYIVCIDEENLQLKVVKTEVLS